MTNAVALVGGAGSLPASLFQDRPYQTRVIDRLVRSKRGLVRAPTGAGKTYIALKAVRKIGYSRLLIVVPRYSAFIAWKRDIEKMGIKDELVIVEKWAPNKRAELWREPLEDGKRQIVLCLYNTIKSDVRDITDAASEFDLVICDESHRIRNRQTKTFKAVKVLGRRRNIIFLTATPQSKGPQDLWTTLHILSPSGFSSYWKFVNRYCVVEDGSFGKEIIGVRKRTLKELRTRVANLVFNIPDSELKGYVPERVRQALHVRMDRATARVYESLREHMLATMPDGSVMTVPSIISSTTRFRQLLVCPRLLSDGLGYGNGIAAILEHMADNDPHAVIFCPFTEAFPLIEEYLRLSGINNIYKLKGGMRLEELSTTIGQFERHKDESDLSVLLCSTTFAESFDLLTPMNAYCLGYDWDQNINYQAEGRLTRGNKTHCNFFYVIHEDTVDTSMLQVLDGKVKVSGALFKDTSEFRKALGD